ncbi:MAG: MoaD/ThiS family protein [Candidatus Heimdallarchaeota archaeon]
MEITIRLGDDKLKETLGSIVKLEVPKNKTIRDVLTMLQTRYSDLYFGDLVVNRRAFLVLVDGVEISTFSNLETELTRSCEIFIIPVIHGG